MASCNTQDTSSPLKNVNAGSDSGIVIVPRAIYTGPRMANHSVQMYETRRERSENSDDCEDMCLTCCCCCCSIFGFLFCCKRMSRTLRIRLLWIWMNILCVTTGVITGVVVFGTNSYEFNPTDMRLIKEKSLGIFCESVNIASKINGDFVNSITFSAYLLNHTPEVNTSYREMYQDKETSFIDNGDHLTRAFYLLSGSKIKVSSCSDSFVEMYVIQGKSNYNQWISENMLCLECYKDEINVFSDSCDRDRKVSYTLDVKESDMYYFVYVNRVQETWVTSEIYVNRTLFNIPNETIHCEDSDTCNLKIDIFTSKWIVVHAAAYHNRVDSVILEITCNSRTWTYLLIFLFVPTIICILISILIYKFCKDPREEMRHNAIRNIPSERTPLLSNQVRLPVSGIIQPPKYEDIVRGDNWNPPSYEEAILNVHGQQN